MPFETPAEEPKREQIPPSLHLERKGDKYIATDSFGNVQEIPIKKTEGFDLGGYNQLSEKEKAQVDKQVNWELIGVPADNFQTEEMRLKKELAEKIINQRKEKTAHA